MRLGGDFELSMSHFSTGVINDRDQFLHDVFFVDSGRSAITVAIEDCRKLGAQRIWLPRYICPTIVPFLLRSGLQINYYSMRSDLISFVSPPKICSADIFIFVNYFGKKNFASYELIKKCKLNSINFHIIEDNVMGCLSTYKSIGDYVVGSIRKHLHVPDGGYIQTQRVIQTNLLQPSEEYISKKIISKVLRAIDDNTQHLKFGKEGEDILDAPFMPREMSSFSTYILERTDINSIRKRRCCNWNYLNKKLAAAMPCENQKMFVPLFNQLEEGEIPLGFPVLVASGKRDVVRRYLAENGIFAPVHWPNMQEVFLDLHPEELYLADSLLMLPIDQRMIEDDVDYLANKLMQFSRNEFSR